MGYNTWTVGHLDIDPPLRLVEQRYLTAFSQSRRFERPGGPYEVPPNPAAALRAESELPTEVADRIADGQPNYWCDWAPCWDGCCISPTGKEKSYSLRSWLDYLIDHFLRPGALASGSGSPWLEGFGFDHRLDGIIACQRDDNRELWLIRVDDNVVREDVLRKGDPPPWM